LPKPVSDEGKKILNILGAKLIFASTEAEAIKKSREMAKNAQYFMADQFADEMNWKAYFQTNGEEILEQTEGRITHFVAGIGTSGTMMGMARKLREFKEGIQIIGVQPSRPSSRQQGLLNLRDFCPEICKYDDLDEMLMVEDEDAFKTARDLLLKEGLFVGIFSGSVMWGAIQKAKEINEGLIVTIFGDHGFKYIGTSLFG
jgi:cysteine synthase